jgi:Ran GTPase-activating protein (RanGAP) involved in mRNA processing and transport
VVDRGLTDKDLDKLIAAGRVRADMVEVKLPSNRLTAHAVQTLARSPLKQLQALDLYDNPIGDAGARVIAKEPVFRGVNLLNLGHTGMTRSGVQALLADDAMLTGPTTLQLHGIPLGDAGLAFLLKSRFAKHLSNLNLSKTGITTAGARGLLAPGALPELMYLDISGNKVDADTIAALRRLKMDFRLKTD